jgi:hypothetical protein
VSAIPPPRLEKRLLPGWMYRPIFLCALTVAAAAALIIGYVMPLSMAYQPRTRTPYELPAHHAVFVHTSRSSVECIITEHGDIKAVTDHFLIGKPGLVSFTGHRLSPQATAGATLLCDNRVAITVDPDWRYTLANSQPAKVTLTFFGAFAWLWVFHRVRDRFRRSRRSGPIELTTGGGSGSSPRRETWRRAGRRRERQR